MASNLVPPEALKSIKPYLTLASQLEVKGEKIIAYYCRLYAIQNGMQVNKTAPECKKFLLTLMDILENNKKEIQNEEAIQSSIVGQAYVERHALRIFENADEDDRNAKFTKNLVRQFYSAGLLFDSLSYFGELSDDLILKKQYAKRKAMYLNRCFATGETPIAGPLVNEDGNDEFGFSTGTDLPNPSSSGPSSSSSHFPSSTSPDKGHSSSSFHPNAFNQQEPSNQYNQISSGFGNINLNRPESASKNISNSNTVNEETKTNYSTIDPALMLEAQKLCKHATSALSFDDVTTAITKLEACLRILKSGKL